mgnify:CR=1 FL=1
MGAMPDLTKVEAIMAYDFAANLKINAEAGAVPAGTAAAIEPASRIRLTLTSGRVWKHRRRPRSDGRLQTVRPRAAAPKGMADIKGKMGANAKITTIKEPTKRSGRHEGAAPIAPALRCEGDARLGEGRV